MDKLKINIRTNGHLMSLLIDPKQEQVYRSASKLMNERIELYNERFDAPYIDILHMVAYELAVEYNKLLNEKQTMPEETLNDLTELLKGVEF